ncbi:MAG: hypothetical protein K2X50_09765 [Gammaproteobacteria bacterium]|nr:hypothetical protein [Gammaproteobacteria bacterium]
MTLIQTITDPFVDYYNALPQDSTKKIITSFGIVFVLESLTLGNPYGGLYCGSVSATATAIYALITPLMRSLANGRAQFTAIEELFRAGVACITASMLVAAVTNPTSLRALGLDHNLRASVIAALCAHVLRICFIAAGNLSILPPLSLNTTETNWLMFIPAHLLDV